MHTSTKKEGETPQVCGCSCPVSIIQTGCMDEANALVPALLHEQVQSCGYMRSHPAVPWLPERPASLLREHGRLHSRSGLLDALRGVQLGLLRVGLLQRRRCLLHVLLGPVQLDVLDLLEVVDQDGQLVGVDAGEAAHDDEGLPLAGLLVAEHADVQRGHHGRVVRQHAQLAAGARQNHLRHGLSDPKALRGQHLELHAVRRGAGALLGSASSGAPQRPGLMQGIASGDSEEHRTASLPKCYYRQSAAQQREEHRPGHL
mmetsp:Transcript_120630/g.352306  ORF Transcript_120630/g.352306 Transcript_120630/m.352306 type:complete len:259 (-) Transcript_120630:81-857(-)